MTQTSQKRLVGKVALVTGSSRGIGKAIAKSLAAEGATMAIHYCRGRDQASELAGEFEKGGTRVGIFQADVSRLKALIGWTPKDDLRRGLHRLLVGEGVLDA